MESSKIRALIGQGIRFFIYVAAAFLLAELIRFDAQIGSIETKFSEDSYTEYMQSIFFTYIKYPTFYHL